MKWITDLQDLLEDNFYRSLCSHFSTSFPHTCTYSEPYMLCTVIWREYFMAFSSLCLCPNIAALSELSNSKRVKPEKRAVLRPSLSLLWGVAFRSSAIVACNCKRSLLPVEYTSTLVSAKNSLCKYNLVQHPGNPGTEWIEQTTCFLTPENGSEHMSWCCWAAGTDISCLVRPASLMGDFKLQGSKLEHWKNTQLTMHILVQFNWEAIDIVSSD